MNRIKQVLRWGKGGLNCSPGRLLLPALAAHGSSRQQLGGGAYACVLQPP